MNSKIDNIHISAYLTIMSIVQGAVFAYLLLYNIENIKEVAWFDFVFKTFVAWILIVFIWHEYVLGVMFYSWFYRLFDSFIPFAIGVSEVFVIYTIKLSDKYWYASLAVLSAVVLSATINQHWKVYRDENNSIVYLKTKKYLFFSEILYIASIIFMSAVCYFSVNNPLLYSNYSMVFKASPLVILIIIGIRTRLYTNAYLLVVNKQEIL